MESPGDTFATKPLTSEVLKVSAESLTSLQKTSSQEPAGYLLGLDFPLLETKVPQELKIPGSSKAGGSPLDTMLWGSSSQTCISLIQRRILGLEPGWLVVDASWGFAEVWGLVHFG